MDTAWHQTMPAHAYMYALPYEWYEKYGVRRYGFHGTSFLYVAKRAALLLGKDPFETNLVCLHIGNGVSANAIKNGVSFDTSHGPDPARGPGHGHPVRRPRRGHRPHGHGEGRHRPGQDERHPEQEVGRAGHHRQVHRPPRRPAGGRGGRRPGPAGRRRRGLPDQEVHRRLLRRHRRRRRHRLHGRRRRDVRPHPREVARGPGVHGHQAGQGQEQALAKTRNAETEISAADSKVKVFVIPTDEERVNIEDVIAILEGKYDEHTRFTYRFQSPAYENSQREQDFRKECEKKPGLKDIQVKPKK